MAERKSSPVSRHGEPIPLMSEKLGCSTARRDSGTRECYSTHRDRRSRSSAMIEEVKIVDATGRDSESFHALETVDDYVRGSVNV